MEFEKFYIQKKKWYKSGNFQILDSDKKVVIDISSDTWKIKKSFRFFDAHNDQICQIKILNNLMSRFELLVENKRVARINKVLRYNHHRFEILPSGSSPILVLGNAWGTKYRFVRNEEEIALLSANIWSNGSFGLAIRKSEPVKLILSVVIIIAYLKENAFA